jgi:hypothetical protein
MARRHIHYAQAAMTEADATINKDALIVRPSMAYHIAHTLKHAHVNRATRSAR